MLTIPHWPEMAITVAGRIGAVVEGIEIEQRRPPAATAIAGVPDQSNLGDRIAAIGPWEGESMDEIIEILRGGRDESGHDRRR